MSVLAPVEPWGGSTYREKESGGGGIIDVCNDPDIFEKILPKRLLFFRKNGAHVGIYGHQSICTIGQQLSTHTLVLTLIQF